MTRDAIQTAVREEDLSPVTQACLERSRMGHSSLARASARRAFTLVELTIVLGIIVILSVLTIPAISSRKNANDVTRATNELKALLDKARAYAQANNTYVFVGFEEVDASIGSSVSPKVPGNGRTVVAAVASKDGTRHCVYTKTNQGADWTANYNNGANLVAVINPQVFENLHFSVDFGSWTPTSHPTSNMARYQPSNTTYTLGNAGSTSVTPFTWPLDNSLTSGYKYRFDKVVNFDPSG